MSNKLIVTRGIPGSGKTHFLKEKGLEDYVVSPDKMRVILSAPQLTEEGNLVTVFDKNENQVRRMISDILENRLKRGDLTVVDATHLKLSLWNDFRQLAQRHQAELICLDFSDVELETAKKRNRLRPVHSRLSDGRIDLYAKQLEELLKVFPKSIKVVKKEDWNEEFKWEPINYSEYKKIHHFGDIHGCVEPLKEYLKEGLNKDELYVFCGDYIDRGIQNAEVLNFLFTIMYEENVVFLEGNHEAPLRSWSNNETNLSREFARYTKPELEEAGVSLKKTKRFVRRLRKALYYTHNKKRVIVTHGGISNVPNNLHFLSTEQMIRGVGNYDTKIDEIFSHNSDEDLYQVHGHRNIHKLPIRAAEKSFNLEGSIESGGSLRVLTLDIDGEFNEIEVKNNIFSDRFVVKSETEEKINSDFLDRLRGDNLIRENVQENFPYISSFNFKSRVETKNNWNKERLRARGLYVNTRTTEIVARSYDKFFNAQENESSTLEAMSKNLVFPVNIYEKENGFLGILGYDSYNRQLVHSTKNYIDSKHSGYFKEIFSSVVPLKIEGEIRKYLEENNLSLQFEVIDPINDPHIIEYDKPRLILLDAVYRQEKFKKMTYMELKKIANKFGLEVKTNPYTFYTWGQFERWYNDCMSDEENQIEGYVIEDSFNKMYKVKTPYYKFWKSIRNELEKQTSKPLIVEEGRFDEKSTEFIKWYKTLSNRAQDNDIINLRKQYKYAANL